MDYTLFDEFITLQALLKELGIIDSGGAAKNFLLENTILFNGERENRRGKKLRHGDFVELPDKDLTIRLKEPSLSERQAHEEELAEKKRVANLVKELNKTNKKSLSQKSSFSKKQQPNKKRREHEAEHRPVRFPGT